MFVRKLELKKFRNYERLSLQFGEKNNVFCGANGQGKTNILEAIYLTTCARSHRTGKDRELIRQGENFYEITLHYTKDNGSEGELHFRFDLAKNSLFSAGGRKQERTICYNKLPLTRLAELFGLFHAVIFAPEDLMLIKEGPGERRRFIDILISQVSPRYFSQLQVYQKILKHRNSYLKSLREEEKISLDKETQYLRRVNLDVWDEQLAESAAFIIYMRNKLIDELTISAREAMYGLSDAKEHLEINYIPPGGIEASHEEKAIKESLIKKLWAVREEDIFRGYTSIGPHRDDIDFLLNTLPAKHYASQGQQRSLVLSLKIAELAIIENHCEAKAVLLLDDVMSELDAKRRENLLSVIKDKQVFITCTDSNQLSEEMLKKDEENRFFSVEAASVQEIKL